jgi:large repetitive protein
MVMVNPPIQHTVDLSWTASTSPVLGYNVYRGMTAGGPYALINVAGVVASTLYTDSAVPSGLTYFYVTTAVDNTGMESVYSNEAGVTIPSP